MVYKTFYSACFGFILGVIWRSFLSFNFYTGFLVGIGCLFLILSLFLISKKNWGILIAVFILCFFLGILRLELAQTPPPEDFEKHVGQVVSSSGMISEIPIEKEKDLEITVETKDKPQTKILLFTGKDDAYQYGDEVNFSGKLEKPANFLTDQGNEFDYENYLKTDGILYTMKNPKIETISRGGGNFIKRGLFVFREKLTKNLEESIPQPESLVMRGLILGERASFSQELRQSFINSGLIHIVIIAGYHIALVADWILNIFSLFLPIRLAASGGIITIFLYVLMTGGSQTAIRAGIMAALVLLARITGRQYGAGHALVLAGTTMIILNPLILAFSVSFQLSFLATIAMIHFAPKIKQYFLWIPWKRAREIVTATSSIYAFVLPFILYKTGNLSLVTLPANLAVLPFIPATMILGFITVVLGLISNTLAFIPAKISYFLLHYELSAVNFFSNLPFAALPVPHFPLILTVIVYAMLFFYIFSPKEKVNPRLIIPVAAFLLTLTFAIIISYNHYESIQAAKLRMQALFASTPTTQSFEPDSQTKSENCSAKGPFPDAECTPGAIFTDATVEQICIRGYTQTVRNVSQELRRKVYAEYGIPYPQPKDSYEVDHLIPLALGGSNDIANLWTEAAIPTPGFHEKDLVEVYLQEEVCAHHVNLPTAQRQIAVDWLAVYKNLTPQQLQTLKKKYAGN